MPDSLSRLTGFKTLNKQYHTAACPRPALCLPPCRMGRGGRLFWDCGGNRMGKEALFWAAIVFLVITGSIVISIALKYV
jgi:hypothetical protein